MQTVQG